MGIQDEFDRAMDELDRQLNEGRIRPAEYRREVRALEQDCRGVAKHPRILPLAPDPYDDSTDAGPGNV